MISRFTKYLLLISLLIAIVLSLTPSVLATDVTISVSITSPIVTTSSATSVEETTVILQGTLDSLGGFSPVYVYFQYGLTSSYDSSTEEQTKTATGGFNQSVSELSPNTLYHFRTVARYETTSYVYGNDVTFITSALDTPTVSTVDVDTSEITSSTAILQGNLLSMGSFLPLYVSFQYGLATSYGITTTEETKSVTGTFEAPISGLSSSTVYHYRARVRYDSSNYIYGNDSTFSTIEPELLPPTGLDAIRGDTTITLSWIKDSEDTRTWIRRSSVSFPDSLTSGVMVYFGTGSYVMDTGLDNTQAYYYSAWSEKNDIYSSSYTTVYSAPEGMGEGILPVPDYMGLGNVLILESYQVTGDQLIVFKYDISYITNPSQDASDFFVFEIYDGANKTASGPVMAWGEKPGSIYLSPSNALIWGQAFTLKLTGIPSQWGDSVPVKSYSVASPNWIYDRTSLDKLDIWVFTITRIIDSDWIVTTVLGDFLSDEACTIFNNAIRGLSSIRTEICYYGAAYPEYEDPDFSDEGQEALTRENNLGDYINDLLDDAGSLVGMTGDSMGTMIMAFICLTLMVIIGTITRNPSWAMISTVPVIGFGNYIGLIGLAFTLIITSIIVLYFYYVIWIRGV